MPDIIFVIVLIVIGVMALVLLAAGVFSVIIDTIDEYREWKRRRP